MAALPKAYAWLGKEPGPRMVKEALAEYGTLEVSGPGDNPRIIAWAKEVGINWYKDDSTPWCGLFMAVVAQRAGKESPKDALRALAWQTFGKAQDVPMLGDVLVFKRTGGGHVGLYVAEDKIAFHVLGGNQSNKVSIARVAKSRLHSVRRPEYKIGQPANVRPIWVKSTGLPLSTNEG